MIHLAAETHVDRSITAPGAFVRTNVLGTHVLLEAARAFWDRLDPAGRERFRFLHVSTDEVYGSLPGDGFFAEATPYRPRSPYSASKAGSDHLAAAWFHTYGLPVIVSNCCNNYGPRQFPEKLIPLMILKALRARSCPCTATASTSATGCTWRTTPAPSSPSSPAAAPARPTRSGRGRSGPTGRWSMRSAPPSTRCGLQAPRMPASSRLVADRPGHDRRYAIDPAKIEAETGWRPAIPFEAGLAATVRWYAENEAWWRPLREGVYGGERLGLIRR